MSLTLSCPTIRVLKTLLIFAAYGSVGWADSLLGVNLLDFQIKLDVAIEDMSNVITASYIGLTIGSMILSCGCDKINVHMVYLLCLVVTSISLAIAPHLTSIFWLSFALFMNGLASGAINSASIARILYLWGHECSSFLQILDFTYGIGSIVGPLAASPFLVEIPDLQMEIELHPEDFNSTSVDGSYLIAPQIKNGTHFVTSKDMKLVYPYSMVSSFMAVTFVCGAILFVVESRDVPHPSRLEDEPEATKPSNGDIELGSRALQVFMDEHKLNHRRTSSLPNLDVDPESIKDNELDCDNNVQDEASNVRKSDKKVLEWTSGVKYNEVQPEKCRTRTIGSPRELITQKKKPLAKMASFPILGERRNRQSTTPSVSYSIKKVSIDKRIKIAIIVTTSLMYAFVNGMGMIEAGYLTSYVHESHFKLEMKEGAKMESSSWITHIVSGVISIYVVKKIGLKWNMVIGVLIIVMSNIFMVIMTEISSKEYIMWIGITGISIGGCSFFSSLVSFMESIFPVSSRVASLYLVPNCLSNIIWPQIVGHLIEIEPQVFIYSMAFCAVTCALLLFLLIFLANKVRNV